MAYWGEFTALGFNKVMKEERKAAPEKAKSLAGKASDHEQYYIRAAEHEGTPDDPKEREGYQREMETLIDRHPDDLNAHAFLGLPVMGGYETDGHSREGELYAQAVLRISTTHGSCFAARRAGVRIPQVHQSPLRPRS